jgi:hypothetical protein
MGSDSSKEADDIKDTIDEAIQNLKGRKYEQLVSISNFFISVGS